MALKELPENSVDAIITDPPYGLSFMGKKWDYDVPSVEIWAECLSQSFIYYVYVFLFFFYKNEISI